MTNNTPTLFSMTPRCPACGDIGLELDATGTPTRCWRIKANAVHNEPTPAGTVVASALENLRRERQMINAHDLDVAKTLAKYTSAQPAKKERLIECHFSYSASSLRLFHSAIERLRREWLLPVGSRKDRPSGYWIITEIGDFADWVDRAKSAPITQLTTIHRVAKRNFPVFAEQMELDFWNDIDMTPIAAAA